MTDEKADEPVVDPVTPEPDTPSPDPEPTPSVADKVREAGRKDHSTKRSLEDLEPDNRKLVEDIVSATLSQKTQDGTYMTASQVQDQIATERAEWEAANTADRTFHTRLAAEGVLPGTEDYKKVEAVVGMFSPQSLLTEAGVAAVMAAARVGTGAPAPTASDTGTPVAAPGVVGAPADFKAPSNALGNTESVRARMKRLASMDE